MRLQASLPEMSQCRHFESSNTNLWNVIAPINHRGQKRAPLENIAAADTYMSRSTKVMKIWTCKKLATQGRRPDTFRWRKLKTDVTIETVVVWEYVLFGSEISQSRRRWSKQIDSHWCKSILFSSYSNLLRHPASTIVIKVRWPAIGLSSHLTSQWLG